MTNLLGWIRGEGLYILYITPHPDHLPQGEKEFWNSFVLDATLLLAEKKEENGSIFITKKGKFKLQGTELIRIKNTKSP